MGVDSATLLHRANEHNEVDKRRANRQAATTASASATCQQVAAVCSGSISVPLPLILVLLLAAAVILLVGAGLSRKDSWTTIDVNLLLSIDERPGAEIRKLDEQGRWELFEGLSVVMPVRTERHSAFRQLFNRVHIDYSMLLTANPFSSYHVTLCTIVLRRDMSQSMYNKLVADMKPQLERLKARLAGETQSVTFNFSGVWWNPAGISIDLQPASEANSATLRYYEAIAADSLGALYVPMQRYHMGWSYIVQSHANGSEVELAELVSSLPGLFAEVAFVATVPQLVTFSTMLRFIQV